MSELPPIPQPDSPRFHNARLKTMLRLNLAPIIGNAGDIPVIGREHLTDVLQAGKPPVVAVSHTSDIDLQLATYALSDAIDPLITSQSTNYNGPAYLGMAAIGMEHFAPLRWQAVQRQNRSDTPMPPVTPWFNPTDYDYIEKSVSGGKTPIVAAHNPTYHGRLPRTGGIADVYLSHKIGSGCVVPVAVWIDDVAGKPTGIMGDFKTIARNLVRRPNGHMAIGKALQFEHIDISPIETFFAKRQRGQEVTPEERAAFSTAHDKIKAQSKQVMDSISMMMPEEKRYILPEIDESKAGA